MTFNEACDADLTVADWLGPEGVRRLLPMLLPVFKNLAQINVAQVAFNAAVNSVYGGDERGLRWLTVRHLELESRMWFPVSEAIYRWHKNGVMPEGSLDELWRHLRNRASWIERENWEVQPAILDGKDVEHFDDLDIIDKRRWETIGAAAHGSLRIDPEVVLLGCGLDAEERRLILANKIDDVPFSQMAAYLGWDRARVERVRRRCSRKLRALVPPAERIAGSLKVGKDEWPEGMFERLDSGRLVLRPGSRPKIIFQETSQNGEFEPYT
jgi:hypothetical protein